MNSVSIQSSGDRIRIYRVIATGINGSQVQLESAQLNSFLYLGQAANFDLSRVGSQIVRLDILAEAWDNGLGLSVIGNSGNVGGSISIVPQQPVQAPIDHGSDYGYGGNSNYVCASRDNDGRNPYVMAIRRGIQVERMMGETYSTEVDCSLAIRSIRQMSGKSLLCVSRDNDGKNPYQLAMLQDRNVERIGRTVTNSKMECDRTLNSLRPSYDGTVAFCVSRDNDGRNPYTAVSLDLYSGRLEMGSETFSDIGSCERFLGH